MLHVHVAQLVAPGAQPPGHRSERFRKRQRRISPVRASQANELAYRSDMRVLIGALKIITHKHLVPELRAAFPGVAGLTSDAAAPPRTNQIVDDVARRFGGIGKQAEIMARNAAARVLGSVDDRLARSVRDSVGVNITPYLSRDGRITKRLGEKVIENVNLIETIPSTYFQNIADAVAGNWQEGTRWDTLAERIAEIGDVTDSRAKIIARDQTAKMNTAFNQIRQTDIGIDEYDWATSDDERVRGMPGGKYEDAESDHYDLNGQTFSWNEPGPCKGTIDGEPCHPGEDILCRCFIASTQVHYAGSVEKAFRRWYSGELTELVTDSGKTLRCTPNHPVLTLRGWLPAHLLNEMDYVVEVADKVLARVETDHDDRIPLIGEIFQLAAERGVVEARKGSNKDFHGDGSESDVDIVLSSGALRVDVLTDNAKSVAQFDFTKAQPSVTGTCAFFEFCKRALHTAYRCVGFFREFLAFFGAEALHAQHVCLAAGADFNARFSQASANSTAIKAKLLGDCKLTGTAEILSNDSGVVDVGSVGGGPAFARVGIDTTGSKHARDQVGAVPDGLSGFLQSLPFGYQLSRVVENRSVEWSGHVFNLQTRDGWYVANGIVAHNCDAIPHIDLDALEKELGIGPPPEEEAA